MEEGDEREWLDCRWVLKGDSESGESESRASLWYCKRTSRVTKRRGKKEREKERTKDKEAVEQEEHAEK